MEKLGKDMDWRDKRKQKALEMQEIQTKQTAAEAKVKGDRELDSRDTPPETRKTTSSDSSRGSFRGIPSLWSFDILGKIRRELHFKHQQADGRLPLSVKVFYGAPTLVHQAGAILMIQLYALVFYEDLGMALSTQAAIMALARSIDVVTDPTMSYFTDNLSSRHGRRRPFMITGCWLYAIALVGLMSPPKEGVDINLWFGLFYIFFFLASTFCAIPYDALGPELTDNYEDRNQLFMFSNLFSMLGMLVGAGACSIKCMRV
jgi:hypothetical protein